MVRKPSRRRLLASTGLLLSAGAVPAVGAARPGSSAESTTTPTGGSGPPPVRWNRLYSAGENSRAKSLFEADGQYVAFGTTRSGRRTRPWLFGVDATTGQGTWSRTLQLNAESETTRQYVAATSVDDEFVLLGVAGEGGPFELVRVATDGTVRWRQTYEVAGERSFTPPPLPNVQSKALTTVDDGIVVVGGRLNRSENTGDALVMSVGTDGTEQWRTTLFDGKNSLGLSLSETDSGYVGTAATAEKAPEGEQPPTAAGVFGLGTDGSVQWQNEFFAEGQTESGQASLPFDHAATGDGYLLVGAAGRFGQGTGWLVTTGPDGAVRSQRTLEQPPAVPTTVVADGDTYYATGSVNQRSSRERPAWIGALDGTAEVQWSETPARGTRNAFGDLLTASDGGFAVAGQTVSQGDQGSVTQEAWLVKLGGDPVPASTATATETPTPTETSTPAETGTPAPAETATPYETPVTAATTAAGAEDRTTSGDGPGFGVVGTLAALGAGALFGRVRDDGREE